MEVYTDGSCKMSSRDGGWAMVVVSNDEVYHEDWGTDKLTTNNVMELTALEKGLLYAIGHPEEKFTLFTDSQYCSKGYNEWCKGWEKKSWKTSTNKKVENLEIWQRLHKLRASNVKVEWVKGHSDNKWNNYCDSLTRNYE